MNLKRVWDTHGHPSKPEFKISGLALDRVQFAYRNVVGDGATSKPTAVLNWIKQVIKEVR